MGSTNGYPLGSGVATADAPTGRGPHGDQSTRAAATSESGTAILVGLAVHPRTPGPALMRVGRGEPVVAAPGPMPAAWEAQARDGARQRNARRLEHARSCIPLTATDVAAGTRRCAGCDAWLPAEAFHRDANDPLLGRVYSCTRCTARKGPGRAGGERGRTEMGFQIVTPGRLTGTGQDDQVVFVHNGRGLVFPDSLARAVGIDGRAVVLWDAETRRLALRPPGADEGGLEYRVSEHGRNRRFTCTPAFRLSGITQSRRCPARVEDSMVVVDVGPPDAEETA